MSAEQLHVYFIHILMEEVGKLLRGSLKITKTLSKNPVCTFTLYDLTKSFSINDKIKVWQYSSPIYQYFEGYVKKFNVERKGANQLFYRITAEGIKNTATARKIQMFYSSFSPTVPSATYAENCGDIVRDISTQLGLETNTVFDGINVSNLHFDDLYADRCFDILAAANDYIWYMDNDSKINFHPMQTKSYSAIPNSAILLSQPFDRSHSFDNLYTRLTFRNAYHLSDTKEEVLTPVRATAPDGTEWPYTYTWKSQYQMIIMEELTYSGTVMNTEVDKGQDYDGDYPINTFFWNPYNYYVRINSNHDAVPVSKTVSIKYKTFNPETVVIDAPNAQVKGVGIIDKIVENTITRTREDTEEFGKNLLQSHTRETVNIQFSSNIWYALGGYYSVPVPGFGNMSFLIYEDSITEPKRADQALMHTYRATNNPNGGKSINWWDIATYDPYRDPEKPANPVEFTVQVGLEYAVGMVSTEATNPAPKVISALNKGME